VEDGDCYNLKTTVLQIGKVERVEISTSYNH